MPSLSAKVWVVPEGYIPSKSVSTDPALVSHEAACILNAGDRDAQITVTLYFEDRDPLGPYRVAVSARRTRHLRVNDLNDPCPVPRDTSYASVIDSSEPIVVQHTRLASRDPHVALLSTIAWTPV